MFPPPTPSPFGAAICLTGLERSFDASVAANIRTSVLAPLAAAASPLRLFGVQPANASWAQVLTHLTPHDVAPQRPCRAAATAPQLAWYTCKRGGGGGASQAADCGRWFVQELCDLSTCERLLRRHERRVGAAFALAARLRLDLVWELPLTGLPSAPPLPPSVAGAADVVSFAEALNLALRDPARLRTRVFSG